MQNYLRKVAVMLIVLFATLPMYAQADIEVKCILLDKTTEEPVAFATVSLTPKGAKKALKYVLTDHDGFARLEKVRVGTYILKAEMMGYKAHEQEIKVSETIQLGRIMMEPDVEMLSAAQVSDVGNPIVVKKDTVEYNASSFKTTDNDMLEDLLKKLPGVEVAEDGSVTANGETISKITIDGKTFFLDDPSLASKNIPAKMIKKVKVVEKKSDQAMFTGIDDGQEETIIDLSIRPGMMNGLFGNLMVGGGHDVPQAGYYSDANPWTKEGWRFQGAGMVGNFTPTSQISVIFNANNTNNRGFNDLAGGMMGNMRGGGGMGRGRGGWGSGNGITTSWMGGLNGAFTLCDGDMDLGGNYLYSGTNKYIEEESSKITYLDGGDRLIYDNDGHNITNTNGHRIGLRLDHKFSDKTSILFQPQFSFGGGDFTEASDFTTYTNDKNNLTNRGFNHNTGYNKNWRANGFLLFRQRLNKPGRTLSLMSSYNFNQNRLNGFNQSLTENWEENVAAADTINQRYENHTSTSSVNARLSYTEPLTEKLYLEASYSYNWSQNKSVKDTWNSGYVNQFTSGNPMYSTNGEVRDEIYSNDIVNRYQNHNAGLTFQYQTEKLRAQLGGSIRPTITDNTTNGETYNSTVLNWSPQAMFSYEFNDNSDLRFHYWGNSSQPSTTQLMPVPDNSNPLNVSFGNPYLLPYFNHSLRGMFGYTNKETFFSLRGNVSASMVQNPITSALWYGSNGAQYTMPMNGPSTSSAGFHIFLNSPIAKSDFSIMSMSRANYSNSASFIGKSAFKTEDYYNAEDAEFDYELFNKHFGVGGSKDMSEFFTTNKIQSVSFTERLRLTYRTDLVELALGGRTRFNKSWYTVAESNVPATWNNQVDFNTIWTIPCGLTIKTEFDYNWYLGYTTPQEDEFIFNAEISQTLFKKSCTLTLKGYDIFNQAKNLSITDSANYHQEVRNNTLGRYVILSFTYRFGDFSKHMHGGQRGPHGPRR